MYVSAAKLTDFHRKAPWIEFPAAIAALGGTSRLIVGDFRGSWPTPFPITKTGFRPSVISGFLELPVVLREISLGRPRIFLLVNVRAPVFLLAAVARARAWLARRETVEFVPTQWFVKLDWGERGADQSRFAFAIKTLLIGITSIFFDGVITESTCARDRVSALPFVRRHKVIVLPNGYPQDIYDKFPYGGGERTKTVLSVGRISRIKGQDLLIRAFLRARQGNGDWKLRIVGSSEDPDFLDEIRTLCGRDPNGAVGIQTDVSESELLDSYRHCSIFCLPSRGEGFAQVRMEAMSQGLPVITSDAGCGRDLGNMGALVFPIDDETTLTRALETLMTNEELRRAVADKQLREVKSYAELATRLLDMCGIDMCPQRKPPTTIARSG